MWIIGCASWPPEVGKIQGGKKSNAAVPSPSCSADEIFQVTEMTWYTSSRYPEPKGLWLLLWTLLARAVPLHNATAIADTPEACLFHTAVATPEAAVQLGVLPPMYLVYAPSRAELYGGTTNLANIGSGAVRAESGSIRAGSGAVRATPEERNGLNMSLTAPEKRPDLEQQRPLWWSIKQGH